MGLGDWGWQLPAESSGRRAVRSLNRAGAAAVLRDGDAAEHRHRRLAQLARHQRARRRADHALRQSAAAQPVSDSWQSALILQPYAGLLDIPLRIYFGVFEGRLRSVAWPCSCSGSPLLVGLGRWWLGRVLRSLEMQGG